MWPINLETYRLMLRITTEHRKTIRFSEIDNNESFVLWRHDCDMSLNRARAIAEIDAENGVSSTFFILPHSDFYNILELGQTKLIRDIAKLGHAIGLHLDVEYHSMTSAKFNIESAIARDRNLLEDISETKIEVFSFHNPTPDVLKFQNDSYADLINCYSKQILGTVSYGSDSNGYWRHEPIPQILQDLDRTRLQILTHPEWWLESDELPRDRVLRCAYGRAQSVIMNYDKSMSEQENRNNELAEDFAFSDYERAIKIL
jgi:hypothetical protein